MFQIALPLGAAHLPRERIKAPRSLASTAVGAQAFVQEALRWMRSDAAGTTELRALAENPTPPADRRLARTAGSRILLADDNADMRGYVRELLASVYLIEAVPDGAEALAAARRERPDLILSDIMMPRLDGLALLSALRADESLRDVPVILVSARAGEEARLAGLDAGADDYLVKPFSARELLARVGALLDLTRIRRESAQALREREEQLRLATEAAEVGLWDVDVINDQLYWPARVKLMFGISPELPVSMADFYAGLHPADRRHTSEAFAAALDPARRALYDVEYRTVGKEDGLIRWVAAKGRGIFDASGRCVRVIGTAIDITARKQAEESLREREEALRRTHADLRARTAELTRFNQAAVGRELRIIELKEQVNRLSAQLGNDPPYRLEFDREPTSPRQRDVGSAGPAESESLVPVEAILRTEQLRERPDRPPDYEAESHAMMALVQALVDSPQTILQTLAEKTLEMMRAGSAGLSLLAADGERFYWAAIAGAWSPHLGGGTPRGFGPCGDVLDRNAPLLFTHWERRYPYLAEATPLAEEGLLVPFHVEGKAVGTIWAITHDPARKFDLEDLRLLQSLGKFATAAYQAIEYLGALDQRRAALNLLEDVVQARQQAEESNHKLRESERALDEANRRKDEFLAMLAHELRNPLAPIGNASELLARTVGHDTRARTAVGMIKRQVTQLTRLVDDLLDVSRITQGRIQLKRRTVDLAAVITQAVETVEPQLRDKQHKLSVIASSYEPLFVSGDFTRLVQCVGNVLTNAVKYTEPGGEITVHTRDDETNAYVEISDTGTGIPPELLPRVFDLFVQGERTLDRAQGGLGIGLAVVKRLVEMHDGQIDARSAGIGRGSTFEIRLPRIARPGTATAEMASAKAQPRRILIVDDNADAANSLSMLLSLQGHETHVAHNGRDAIACAEAFEPDVGLLDIGLPEMDGYELAKRLRAMPRLKELRLIALTGYGQAEDRERALAAGFDAHIIKPLDMPVLERALG